MKKKMTNDVEDVIVEKKIDNWGKPKVWRTVKLLLISAVFGGLCGCDQDERWNAEAVSTLQIPLLTERIQFNEIRPAFKNEDGSPEAYMRVVVPRPILCNELAAQQERLEQWISGMLTADKYPQERMRKALGLMCDSWFDGYQEAAAESRTDNLPRFLGYWFVELSAEMYFYNEDYLSYSAMLKEFAGGLHTFDVCYRYGVWSFRDQRPMTIDDFFEKDQITNVVALVREAVARAEGYTNYSHYAEERFADIDKLPENFAIEDRGMEFVYNCYEIGSYSLGIVKANVTWDDLSPFLKQGVALPWMPFYTKGGRIHKKALKNVMRIDNLEFGEMED